MDYLLRNKDFALYNHYLLDGKKLARRDKKMRHCQNKYTYMISDMGMWYSIEISHNGYIYNFVDSLKLLPFDVKTIGKNFKTKYQKLEMEYKGEMHAGGYITSEQRSYIQNDVLVMHEAMNKILERGMNKMTIGACCMSDFKERTFYGNDDYLELFPNLYEVDCPIDGFDNADAYIRKSYHGGWCFADPRFANKEQGNGCTFDANSHYPSQMH